MKSFLLTPKQSAIFAMNKKSCLKHHSFELLSDGAKAPPGTTGYTHTHTTNHTHTHTNDNVAQHGSNLGFCGRSLERQETTRSRTVNCLATSSVASSWNQSSPLCDANCCTMSSTPLTRTPSFAM